MPEQEALLGVWHIGWLRNPLLAAPKELLWMGRILHDLRSHWETFVVGIYRESSKALESPRPFKYGSMTPLFGGMTPFVKGHGDSRYG